MTDILYTKDGAVASLRFNRPEKKNAITTAMYDAMAEAVENAASDDAVRVLGIFGGEVFTAGNDIGDFLAAGAARLEEIPAIRFLKALARFPKPALAGVKGAAAGIGTTLLLHCDAVVAGQSARFTLPFTRLGLVPEAASSLLLPLVAGRMRASWLLLSGEQFGAEEAERYGIVTRVTADAGVDGTVANMCRELAELPPNAVRTTKRLLKARTADLVESTIDEETGLFTKALQSSEAREAFLRFMQRK
jgi:enoyl-CoA hydratase/carnithine racemase